MLIPGRMCVHAQVKQKIANVEGALGGTHNYLGITEPVRKTEGRRPGVGFWYARSLVAPEARPSKAAPTSLLVSMSSLTVSPVRLGLGAVSSAPTPVRLADGFQPAAATRPPNFGHETEPPVRPRHAPFVKFGVTQTGMYPARL